MGCALARRAAMRGADVTLVCANMTVEPPPFVTVVKAESAEDMFNAVTSRAPKMDVITSKRRRWRITPETVAEEKIKKHDGGIRAGVIPAGIFSYRGGARILNQNLLPSGKQNLSGR